jgi:hypothetical protein
MTDPHLIVAEMRAGELPELSIEALREADARKRAAEILEDVHGAANVY